MRSREKTGEGHAPAVEVETKAAAEVEGEVPEEAEENELLLVLQSLAPDGFERLCKRLLHEYGLEKVVVTGKSHDGGIDGTGLLRLNPFDEAGLSFDACHKAFQFFSVVSSSSNSTISLVCARNQRHAES